MTEKFPYQLQIPIFYTLLQYGFSNIISELTPIYSVIISVILVLLIHGASKIAISHKDEILQEKGKIYEEYPSSLLPEDFLVNIKGLVQITYKSTGMKVGFMNSPENHLKLKMRIQNLNNQSRKSQPQISIKENPVSPKRLQLLEETSIMMIEKDEKNSLI
ncbi:MAG: hypothetical protein INQ03_02635 [Candidatus Heimdallarchaeota archaeon]|nr:hypothetical protein [Candidatus Heimdallarchaeota archaeon]